MGRVDETRPIIARQSLRPFSSYYVPLLLASFALTGGLTLPDASARAQCPASSMQMVVYSDSFSTTAPTFYDSTAYSVVRGDHRVGAYSLHHSGYLSPTVITARDRFDVTGVPPGTDVNVVLRVLVEGWTYTAGCGASGCCGYILTTVRFGTDSAQVYLYGNTFSGRADFSGAVELPVVLTAGMPKDVEVELYARRCPGGSHTVDAAGQVVFDGTDPDAIVVSCKGFGPITVPARPRTWGKLKTMYR